MRQSSGTHKILRVYIIESRACIGDNEYTLQVAPLNAEEILQKHYYRMQL